MKIHLGLGCRVKNACPRTYAGHCIGFTIRVLLLKILVKPLSEVHRHSVKWKKGAKGPYIPIVLSHKWLLSSKINYLAHSHNSWVGHRDMKHHLIFSWSIVPCWPLIVHWKKSNQDRNFLMERPYFSVVRAFCANHGKMWLRHEKIVGELRIFVPWTIKGKTIVLSLAFSRLTMLPMVIFDI